MSIYDVDDFCWLCSMQGSCCNCELSHSSWSNSTFQESWTFDGHEKSPNFDVDELSFRTTDGNNFLGVVAFENPDLEIDDMMQCLGRGSQQPCAASTPKNNDYAEKWESPGTIPPPDSSSPDSLGADSFSLSTDPAMPTSRREDVTVDRLLSRGPRDHGQSQFKAPYNAWTDSNAFVFPTTTWMNPSPSPSPTLRFQIHKVPSAQTNMGAPLQAQGHPADTSEKNPSMPVFGAAQGSLDEPLCGTSERQFVADDIPAKVPDVCAVTTRTVIEQTTSGAKTDKIGRISAPGRLVPASRNRAIFSDPTILDLAVSAELETVSSHDTENDRPHDATTTSSETNGNDGVASKMASRRVSILPAQGTLSGCLKRRRSSVDGPPESKKVKLDRMVSHFSCAGDSNVESKYQATEPASIRRARSLRSEVSACSEEESTDSLFYPSPLSSPTSRPVPDKDYPATVPSTPLPNSVDYARSKANPLIRTLVVYHRRSLDIPVIPPVPIIAPPLHIAPTFVCSAEDQAIDRIKALLLRERSERARDGLNVHDEKRTERLKATYATDPTFSRRDSASTSDSSDDLGQCQWEEESSRSAIESQESQGSAQSMKILPVQQHSFVDRETWSNAFGIADEFRKQITEWILKKLPKEPVPQEKSSRHGRPLGIDLYDQLTNSAQTQFHAAQLFHRYFLLPDKVQFWKEAWKHERLERECWELHEESGFEWDVWHLAVACMALSVKLHRDCLPPLGPIFAAEFLGMAPHSMSHTALELAQRDIMYTFQFLLGSCTPQDVLDELWNALPTLRKATAPIRDGWTVVQCVTWDRLFESLLEPDMLQYPVTLLTAAALVDGLNFALARHYRTEAEANVCQCNALHQLPVSGRTPDDIESWEVPHFEATQLVDDVILDVRDVLQISAMELDECRMWLSGVGHH